RDIHPEAVDPAVEPEAQNVEKLVANPATVPVEVGLARVENVQVPLAGRAVGLRDARPRRAAEDGLPVVGRLVAARPPPLTEHVAVALRRTGPSGERLLKPGVLV